LYFSKSFPVKNIAHFNKLDSLFIWLQFFGFLFVGVRRKIASHHHVSFVHLFLGFLLLLSISIGLWYILTLPLNLYRICFLFFIFIDSLGSIISQESQKYYVLLFHFINVHFHYFFIGIFFFIVFLLRMLGL